MGLYTLVDPIGFQHCMCKMVALRMMETMTRVLMKIVLQHCLSYINEK